MKILFYAALGYMVLFTGISLAFISGFVVIGGRKIARDYLNLHFAFRPIRATCLQVAGGLMLACWSLLVLILFGSFFHWEGVVMVHSKDDIELFRSFSINSDTENIFALMFFAGLLGLRGAVSLFSMASTLKHKELV